MESLATAGADLTREGDLESGTTEIYLMTRLTSRLTECDYLDVENVAGEVIFQSISSFPQRPFEDHRM